MILRFNYLLYIFSTNNKKTLSRTNKRLKPVTDTTKNAFMDIQTLKPITNTTKKTVYPKINRLFVCFGFMRNYLMIFAITPEPTVLPPSRIAKRRPSSKATGLIRTTFISMLSPGITISTPSGNSIIPVTSVVRTKN